MAIVDKAFREWIADFKELNPAVEESRAVIDTAQYAFAAGRKAQRELHTVPDGYVLVPIDPTPEMVTASIYEVEVPPNMAGGQYKIIGTRAWHKILAARPEVKP